jgi:hypothetical protein
VEASELFDVQVRLEADDAPADAAELVTEALGNAPLEGVTGTVAVSTSDQGVTVRFEGVAAPGASDSPFRLQDVLPVVQALITGIIERLAAGGPPSSPRLVIEVQPAKLHDQRELRHA